MRRAFATLALAGAISGGCVYAAAIPRPAQSTATDSASPMPTDQLVTKTVHEAWVASGRNEDKFFDMVQQLANLSAQNRGITLPNTQEAGAKFGAWIKKEARKDPDQLLYAVVDRAVRYVGKTQNAGTAGSTDSKQ
ncbi:hypothetical protein [Silvibacterium acidisoli]|uniref:hypothetical protein n=1 Tax=Acidobacteriaceae bacterium ZG23-2 TaxID=2883246 RepID=UPI00406D06CA